MAMKTFEVNPRSTLKKTIAIMSSKGGVGKSTVTALIATHLTRLGKRVGILDADIIGPTISKLFAITDKIVGQDGLILPVVTSLGIKLISSQLLLSTQDEPIVWRSPLVLDLIRQFYVDVIWGELDYLLIDLPPGTGDVAMTVLESLHVDEIIMVTTPQEIVQSIVSKGIQMADIVKKPIKGIIENYSYFVCDQCDKKHSFFQTSSHMPIWEKYKIPLLATLPLQSDLPSLIDHGKIEQVSMIDIEAMLQHWKD
jgi:Mrp family chromosome partitioning ATPase